MSMKKSECVRVVEQVWGVRIMSPFMLWMFLERLMLEEKSSPSDSPVTGLDKLPPSLAIGYSPTLAICPHGCCYFCSDHRSSSWCCRFRCLLHKEAAIAANREFCSTTFPHVSWCFMWNMHLIVLDYEKYIIHIYSYVRTHDRCFILSPRLLNHIQSLFLTPSHGKNKSLVLDGLAGSLQPATWTSRYNVVEHIVTVADSLLNPTNFPSDM